MEIDYGNKILNAAIELFKSRGIVSVTMDDISKTLAISKKTLYQYFRDKDDIVTVTTNFLIEIDKSEFFSIRNNSVNAIDELFQVSHCIRDKIGNMNPGLLFDLQKYHHEAWKLYVSYKEDVMLDFVAESIKQGIIEGYFRKELDPDIIARWRLEQVQMAFDNHIFPKDKFDFKDVQLHLFDHFVQGIITDKGRKLLNKYLSNSVQKVKITT